MRMEKAFETITPRWLNRAFLYSGSIGPTFHDFRYRMEHNDKEKIIHAATYSKACFEKAEDVEQRDFAWDESGVADMKQWFQHQYEAFVLREKGGGAT